ncbi:hypothetical protein, conserved [Eimeria necatrix]|uniref:Vesicle transport v-SNARE N-terminal domain-containing protein n=1 Tax=Eimeria necatrix TaxID=51315 RepID=U6N0I7_9EIME|nr:hypothetical protein, conserved [Eimeria necatrix]CDJ69988.1 hypothetical protein, conserved [Eimeria necatrix]
MLNEYVTEFNSLHCLGAFEMELRSMPLAERSCHLSQLQTCRNEFASLERRCLLAASGARKAPTTTEGRQCDHTLERLNNANVQLASTRKLAEETEEVGANILCNLYMQRESIQRAKGHAEQTDASLSESRSLISKMGKWWSGLIG